MFLCFQDMFYTDLFLLSVLSFHVIMISSVCVCFFSCCFQMQRRDQPRDSLWTASSITPLYSSARKTTCCMWEQGKHYLPLASLTSAKPSCRRMWVCQKWQNRLLDHELQCRSWTWFASSPGCFETWKNRQAGCSEPWINSKSVSQCGL